MKQYTTPEQTAKLIELGFEKPRVAMPKLEWKDGVPQFHYTIGELIEMLPEKITNEYEHQAILQMTCFEGVWRVKYSGGYDLGLMLGEELVDALYNMVVQLKEEGGGDMMHETKEQSSTEIVSRKYYGDDDSRAE